MDTQADKISVISIGSPKRELKISFIWASARHRYNVQGVIL